MKYLITIILTALVVGFGVTAYFKGWLPSVTFNKPQAVSVQNTEVSNITVKPTDTPVASPFAKTTKVKSGGILVFKAYSLDLPSDWQSIKEGTPSGEVPIDKLILIKGTYKITIYQAATGGAPCLYPGEPDVEGPSSRFTSFVALTTKTGDLLRRGTTQGDTGFTVCEKQGSNDYGQPTSFGHISITTPAAPTPAMILEIDSILSSLTKI